MAGFESGVDSTPPICTDLLKETIPKGTVDEMLACSTPGNAASLSSRVRYRSCARAWSYPARLASTSSRKSFPGLQPVSTAAALPAPRMNRAAAVRSASEKAICTTTSGLRGRNFQRR